MNINSVMRALSLWKQHRCPDAKTTDCRASEPFELVHSEVCVAQSPCLLSVNHDN